MNQAPGVGCQLSLGASYQASQGTLGCRGPARGVQSGDKGDWALEPLDSRVPRRC